MLGYIVGNTVGLTCLYLENVIQVTVNGNNSVPLVAILDDQQKKLNATSTKKKRSRSRFGRRLRDGSKGNNQKTPSTATVSFL